MGQNNRNQEFLESERKRGRRFSRKQRSRVEAFWKAQENWTRQYQEFELRLIQVCKDYEKQRTENLRTWGRALLKERRKELEDLWKREERQRESQFQTTLEILQQLCI
jgi:hypothetical protein